MKILSLAVVVETTSIMAIATLARSATSQLPPELDRLEYFKGTWQCQQPAAPASPSAMFTWTVNEI